MIYVKVNTKWFKTNFNSIYDISILASEYVEYLYDDDSGYYSGPGHSDHGIAPPVIEMEIWMQKPLPFFKEKKFLKTVTHLYRMKMKK